MSDEAPHTVRRPRTAGGRVLAVVAGLLVGLGGFAAALVLPTLTVLTAMGEQAQASWPIYVWAPFAFLAALWLVIGGVQAMDEPHFGRVALLIGIAILAFFSFPPFWYAGS